MVRLYIYFSWSLQNDTQTFILFEKNYNMDIIQSYHSQAIWPKGILKTQTHLTGDATYKISKL